MILFALLVISIILESFSTFPFVILLLVFLSILEDRKTVLLLAFFGGLLIDIFLFRQIGLSAAFFLIFSSLILSYQSKFEADTLVYVCVFTFLGSFFYLLFTNQSHVLLISIAATLISALLYKIYKRKKKQKKW